MQRALKRKGRNGKLNEVTGILNLKFTKSFSMFIKRVQENLIEINIQCIIFKIFIFCDKIQKSLIIL